MRQREPDELGKRATDGRPQGLISTQQDVEDAMTQLKDQKWHT
jgi:hypothetical protein